MALDINCRAILTRTGVIHISMPIEERNVNADTATGVESSGTSTEGWQESDSATFIQVGRVMTPRRDEIQETIVSLIPASAAHPFTVVDIAGGSGWLSAAVLERHPHSRVVMLDGSETMRDEASQSLRGYGDRFRAEPFRLEDDAWMQRIGAPVRCFVSTLAIHHLDDQGKRNLFIALFDRLQPGGAVLIADLVRPASTGARHLAARQWSDAVRTQSVALTGDTATADFFEREHWNIFDFPDAMDTPSSLADQLRWLHDAGYVGADVFWSYAGHAVYGAFRGSE